MIYLFLGKDYNIVNDRVNSLVNNLNISNIIKIDFLDSSIENIINEVNYVDLFNEKKLLIVSNFSLKNFNKKEEEIFTKYINNMDENIIVFKCIDESIDERKSITKLLRSKCKVEEIEALNYKTLHEYISNMFKNNNIKTSFNQIKRILDLCEYNPDYTISEVNKLLIYKIGENELFDKDIEDVISKNNEKEMFALTECVLKKDISGSINSYKILVSSNIDAIGILENIAKQFRLLMQIKILKGKMNESDLIKSLKVNPFVLKKLYPYVNEYSKEDIANILYKLSDIDINIKINGIDKNNLLESFLITL